MTTYGDTDRGLRAAARAIREHMADPKVSIELATARAIGDFLDEFAGDEQIGQVIDEVATRLASLSNNPKHTGLEMDIEPGEKSPDTQ